MYRIVWQYEVHPQKLAEFERAYGTEGEWVKFFARSPDYLGTELYRNNEHNLRFITVDVWRNRTAYEQFRKANAAQYAALDSSFDRLIAHERTLGVSEDGKE